MGNVSEAGSWVIFEIIVLFHNKINSDLNNFGEQVTTDSPQLPVIFTREWIQGIKKYIIPFFHTGRAYSA